MNYLSQSVEAGRIASAERYFEERTSQPSFSITPSFQNYDVIAHDCELQTARPWTEESYKLFGLGDIICIERDDSELPHYTVIGIAGLTEKRLHELLLDFVA